MNSKLTFIHVLSPLHAGTGQGIGVIDLPIAREKATNLPYLPGSTLKGTLRDELKDEDLRETIFGPEKVDNDSAYSGSIVFTDQKLLCLPVRSLLGTFAWVTSPYILERFKRDCSAAKSLLTDSVAKNSCFVIANPENPEIPKNVNKMKVKKDNREIEQVILEDLDLTVQPDAKVNADDWANFLAPKIFPQNNIWQTYFKERFCIVSDDVMNFLAETATEVIARNVLNDETKTSDNLWYEESLPTETILSGLLLQVKGNGQCMQALKDITKDAIQLGGSMTVGRGLCQMIIDGGANNANS